MNWNDIRQLTRSGGPARKTGPVLTATERAVIVACAEVLLPAGGAIPVSGLDAGVVPYVDSMIGRVPTSTRLLLRAMIHFVEFSPWAYGPFKTRMSKLGREDRERVLRILMDSRIYLVRTAFLGLRTVLTIAYFGSEEVNRSIGATANLNPFNLQEAAA